MTVPALLELGHTEASAASVLHKAVSLASAAASSTVPPSTVSFPSSPPSSSSPKVALSLGPYGATLSPGQEYAGLYPPPYGPAGFDADPNLNSPPSNYAPPDADKGHEDALTAFHLDRLRVYASDADTWGKVAWLAFETIPVLRELRAIRRAVGTLRSELRAAGRIKDGEKDTPFWIASAYPKGKIGQLDDKGRPVELGAVVDALVGPLFFDADQEAPLPDGIGINCTNPLSLPTIIGGLSGAVSTRRLPTKPWLLLYPDGGAVYDVVSKTWSGAELPPQQWAERLMALAHQAEGTGVWGGVVLGGCCKSGFEEIAALRKLVDRPMERQWEKSTGVL